MTAKTQARFAQHNLGRVPLFNFIRVRTDIHDHVHKNRHTDTRARRLQVFQDNRQSCVEYSKASIEARISKHACRSGRTYTQGNDREFLAGGARHSSVRFSGYLRCRALAVQPRELRTSHNGNHSGHHSCFATCGCGQKRRRGRGRSRGRGSDRRSTRGVGRLDKSDWNHRRGHGIDHGG